MWSKKSISETLTALLVFLFLYTGLSKFFEHQTFNAVLKSSPLLGSMAGFISYALPGFEILVTALLIIPKTRMYGLWASLVLLTGFTLYLIYMINFTPKLPCSCGGVIKNMTWRQHILFNVSFIVLNSITIWLYKNSEKEQLKNLNYSL
jgi:putative oxidoreductase